MKKIFIASFSFIIASSLILTGCIFQNTPKPSKPISEKKPTKAVIAIDSDPGSLNAISANSTFQFTILFHISDPLIRFDINNKPIPAAAESWNISPDGLTYTFKLRNSKWSDNSDVTAKDFQFSLQKILSDNDSTSKDTFISFIKNASEYTQGNAKLEDVGIKAPDDKTLVLEFNASREYLLTLLASCFPVKQTFFESSGDKFGKESDKLLYNGPWTIKQWKQDDRIILEKNPLYWDKDSIKIDDLTFRVIPESNSAFNAFLADEIDYAVVTSDVAQKAIKQNLSVGSYVNGNVSYIAFNLKDPVMQNIKIRKALSLSFNRNILINTISKELIPAYNFISPIIDGENTYLIKEIGPSFPNINLDEAKKLLAEGLSELPKEIRENATKLNFTNMDPIISEFFKQSWKQNLNIDITSTVIEDDFDKFYKNITDGKFQIALLGMGPQYDSAMDFLNTLKSNSDSNDPKYENANYDSLLKNAEIEPDFKKRIVIFKKMEQQLANDAVVCPVFFVTSKYLIKPYLKGINTNSFSNNNLSLINAYIEGK